MSPKAEADTSPGGMPRNPAAKTRDSKFNCEGCLVVKNPELVKGRGTRGSQGCSERLPWPSEGNR